MPHANISIRRELKGPLTQGAVLALLLLAFLFVALVYLPSGAVDRIGGEFVDDSYILLRYARNLAEGHGFEWNVGEGPVEGASSLAWVSLVAAFVSAGFRPPEAALIAGVACALGAIITVWWAARLHGEKAFCWIGALVMAASPLFARHAVSGMETPLVALAYALVILGLAMPGSRRGLLGPICVGAFSGALFLVRADALIFGLVAPGAAYALQTNSGEANVSLAAVRTNARTLGAFLLAFTLVFVTVFAVRYAYFGIPLPLPAYMKLGVLNAHAIPLNFIVTHWTLTFSYFAVYFLLIILRISTPERLTAIELGLLAGIATFLAYQLLIIPIMNFDARFTTPLLAPVAFLVALAARPILSSLRVDGARRALTVAAAVGVLVLGDAGVAHGLKAPAQADHASYRAVGQALSFDAPVTIASSEAGMLPYYANRRFLDYAGLNNPHIALNRSKPERLRYWDYVRGAYGWPDVYFQPKAEFAYARLDDEAVAQYGPPITVCRIRLYVLRSSPSRQAIIDALGRVKCPAQQRQEMSDTP